MLEIEEQPKAFWSHVQQKLKTKSGVGPLLENNNDITSTKFDDKEKANILQKQFSSVFTREPDNDIPEIEKRTNLIIKDLTATEEIVKREIMQLNVNKSCGPDEIHPRLLIELADIISTPLGLLMNKTIKDGNIPEDWNKANISPIYKKGARNRAENYRPISLTSMCVR